MFKFKYCDSLCKIDILVAHVGPNEETIIHTEKSVSRIYEISTVDSLIIQEY